jgi:hypothetical protein
MTALFRRAGHPVRVELFLPGGWQMTVVVAGRRTATNQLGKP